MVNDLPLFNVTNPHSLWDSKLRNYWGKKIPSVSIFHVIKPGWAVNLPSGRDNPEPQRGSLQPRWQICPLCRLLESCAGALEEPPLTPSSCAVLRSPPVHAAAGGTAQCPPAQCPMDALVRVPGTAHSRLGECSCRAEGAGAGNQWHSLHVIEQEVGKCPHGAGAELPRVVCTHPDLPA